MTRLIDKARYFIWAGYFFTGILFFMEALSITGTRQLCFALYLFWVLSVCLCYEYAALFMQVSRRSLLINFFIFSPIICPFAQHSWIQEIEKSSRKPYCKTFRYLKWILPALYLIAVAFAKLLSPAIGMGILFFGLGYLEKQFRKSVEAAT